MVDVTPFHWKLLACACLAWLAVTLIRCAAWSRSVAGCMRDGIVFSGLFALQAATFALAIWLGIEAGRASGRRWVGWLAGLAVLAAAQTALMAMGLDLPTGNGEMYDPPDWL